MSIEQLEKILLYTGNFLLLLNGILVFTGLRFRVFRKYPVSLIFKWSCSALVLAIFELILIKYIFIQGYFFETKILPVLKLLGISDYSFISSVSYLLKLYFYGLFFIEIFKNGKERSFFKVITIALLIFEFIMIIYFKSYQGYDSLSSTVKNIFILSGSGLLLYRIYKFENSSISLNKNTFFWIGFGLFITATTELFLEFIFTKLHSSDLAGFYKLYLVRNAFQLLFFILMIVAFLNAKYVRFLPDKY